MRPFRLRPALPAATLLVATIAACGPAAGNPTQAPTQGPSARPSPTPVAAPVSTPAEAAALVIATNPLFAGALPQDPNIIGASRWWVATPRADGGYPLEIIVGWGDCPAGCIDRHTWTYEVKPDGTLELVSEAGPEVPAVLPG